MKRFVMYALTAMVLVIFSGGWAHGQPNQIFIMTDDHGWPFYSFMETLQHTHSEFAPLPFSNPNETPLTPNLDRLAARGAVFPVAHSSDSVCVPSFRSTLLGLDKRDFDKQATVTDPTDTFMASYLDRAGYEVSYGYGKIWQKGYAELGMTCVGSGCDITCPGLECKQSIRSKKIGRARIDPLLRFIRGANAGTSPWLAWYSPHLPHSPFNAKSLVEEALCAESELGPIFPQGEPALCAKVKKRCVGGTNHGAACGTCSGGGVCRRSPELKIPKDVDLNGSTAVTRLVEVYTRMCRLERQKDLDGDDACKKMGISSALPRSETDKAYLSIGKNIKYLQNVILLDYWIGELLAFLRSEGLENPATGPMIYLQTDNGYLLKPSKKSAKENGFRTPILVSGPDIQAHWPPPAGRLGANDFRVQTQMVKAIDLIPTMLAYAQAPVNTCRFGQGATLLPTSSCTEDYRCKGGSDDGNVCANLYDCAAPGTCEDTCGCLEGSSLKPYLDAALVTGPMSSPSGPTEILGSKSTKPFLRTDNDCRLFLKKCGTDQVFNLVESPDEDEEDPGCDLQPSKSVLLDELDCWFNRGDTLKMCNPNAPCGSFQ